MDICHITTVHPRYDIRIFWKEAVYASKAGFNVSILVNDEFEDEIYNGVNIISLRHQYSNKVSRIFGSIFNRRVLKKAIQQKANVYQFHDPELLPLGMKLKKLGFNVIYDMHEDVPRQILEKTWLPKWSRFIISSIFEMYENSCIKKLSTIIVPTPFIEDRVRKLNQSVLQICNFPSTEDIEFSNSRYSNKNPTCYVGGLTLTRGIKQIIEATALADVKLKLCGEFSSKSLQDNLLRDFKHVDYLGFLNRKEISLQLSNSSLGFVTLLDTSNDANAYPIKLFEYMAAGIPVIASNFPVYKGIIEKHNCGICVNPLDIREIANAIKKIISDEGYANQLRTNGYNAVLQYYNWGNEGKKLNEHYTENFSNRENL
jgi:glycosyltransferase involved in cell wall biosynthesis